MDEDSDDFEICGGINFIDFILSCGKLCNFQNKLIINSICNISEELKNGIIH